MLCPFLKGDVNMTCNIDVVYNILSQQNPIDKILNLDEDTVIKNPAVVAASCLLPPPEALMAEVDGDEAMYDDIYWGYSNSDFIKNFYNTILASIYLGNHIMVYFPPVEPGETSETVFKFRSMFEAMTGICLGSVENNITSVVSQLSNRMLMANSCDALYNMDVMSPTEFIYWRPVPAKGIVDGVNVDDEMDMRLYLKVAAELQLVYDNIISMKYYVDSLIAQSKQRPVRTGIFKLVG